MNREMNKEIYQRTMVQRNERRFQNNQGEELQNSIKAKQATFHNNDTPLHFYLFLLIFLYTLLFMAGTQNVEVKISIVFTVSQLNFTLYFQNRKQVLTLVEQRK